MNLLNVLKSTAKSGALAAGVSGAALATNSEAEAHHPYHGVPQTHVFVQVPTHTEVIHYPIQRGLIPAADRIVEGSLREVGRFLFGAHPRQQFYTGPCHRTEVRHHYSTLVVPPPTNTTHVPMHIAPPQGTQQSQQQGPKVIRSIPSPHHLPQQRVPYAPQAPRQAPQKPPCFYQGRPIVTTPTPYMTRDGVIVVPFGDPNTPPTLPQSGWHRSR